MKYYKFLTKDYRGEYSGFDFTEYLPNGDQPGKWLPKVNKLVLCKSGYHAFQEKDVLSWLNVHLFEVELRGKKITKNDKVIAQSMRFIRKLNCDDRVLRLFTCWVAEQVLPIFEKEHPNDNRPRKAIEVSRLFADGKVGVKKLAAARNAAWYAARDEAWSADNAIAKYAAESASWAAAYYASNDAARYVAQDAALATAYATIGFADRYKTYATYVEQLWKILNGG